MCVSTPLGRYRRAKAPGDSPGGWKGAMPHPGEATGVREGVEPHPGISLGRELGAVAQVGTVGRKPQGKQHPRIPEVFHGRHSTRIKKVIYSIAICKHGEL